MMKIAIFGNKINDDIKNGCLNLLKILKKEGINAGVYHTFRDKIDDEITADVFTDTDFANADFLISLGGDGTLLDTVPLVKDSGVPVLGINFGHLGFLSSSEPDSIEAAIHSLKNGNYKVEERQLLHIHTTDVLENPFAMNEVAILRANSDSMLAVDVFVDGEFLNKYKGDGLLIATPTGSTAYNLSCGGPIIPPYGNNIIITPVASHTLTVRPLVLPGNAVLELHTDSRQSDFINVNLDARQYSVSTKDVIKIFTESFTIKTVRLPDSGFFKTLREKLLWGR